MKKTAAIFIVSALLSGCAQQDREVAESFVPQVSKIIADTITIDITLRALDTTSYWDVEQHKYINQQALVDYIFDGVYSKRLSAYDFYTGKNLGVKDVKKLEVEIGFSRENVSKIQLKELWFIDSTGYLKKKTYSYTLGLEQYSDKGTFLGHKALFTVKEQ